MHDPWSGNPYQPAGDRLLARCTAHLERRVVRRADAICLATDEAAATLADRYPGVPRDRFRALYNGYDPADFPPVSDRPITAARPIRFVYTGSLYAGRDPFPFLRALSRIIADGRANPADIRVEFIGDCAMANGTPVGQVVADLGLSDVVTISPPIPYSQALLRLSEADVLLLFAQCQPDQIPAKVYEYLHLGRFVLAFTDGATGRLMRETGAGRVVGPDDDVEAALADVLARYRAGDLAQPAGSGDLLRRYQAHDLAGELATLLDRLVARRPGASGAVQGGARDYA
jgi:glycosyltransferase involved in cell wall biosynthesis